MRVLAISDFFFPRGGDLQTENGWSRPVEYSADHFRRRTRQPIQWVGHAAGGLSSPSLARPGASDRFARPLL